MGLDNGIDVRFKNKELFKDMPSWMKLESYDEEYEVLYWRKCWNIRREIFDILRDEGYDVSEDNHSWEISLDTFEKIIVHLNEHCYNYDWWQENNDSIWSWSDPCEVMIEDEDGYQSMRMEDDGCGDNYYYHLSIAFAFLMYLKTKPEDSYTLRFYDSY